MKIWKALVLPILLLASIASAQQVDVRITALGPIRDLARNVPWLTGSGGIANNYIFKPAFQFEDITLYAVSYGGLATSVSYQVWQTGDPTLNGFSSCTNCTASWQTCVATGCSGTLSLAASGSTNATFTIDGPALVTIAATASFVSVNGSLFIVESQRTAVTGGGSPANTAGGALQLSTAGKGWIWSSGFGILGEGPLTGTEQTYTAVANTVLCYQLEIAETITIRSVTINVAGVSAGSSINAAVYTLDGNTKLLDANMSSAVAGNITGAVTATVLVPGVYWFAFSNTGQPNVSFGPSMQIILFMAQMLNKNVTRIATAANATVGGVMPATLGVLTVNNLTAFPVFLLEV